MTTRSMATPCCAALAALALASQAGCGSPAAATPSAPAAPAATGTAAAPPPGEVSARLLTPEAVTWSGRIVATGDLRPDQSAQLAFPIPGTLRAVEVRRGDRVKPGQALASLDAALARATVAQADAGLAAAEAQARMAQDGLARVEAMKAHDGASAAQLVQARAQRDLAAAQVAGARAGKEQAEVNLRYHSLRAPFAGVVTRVPDGVGVTVAPGFPLFGLEATSTLRLDTTVSLEEARALAAGAKAQVVDAATGVQTDAAVVRTVVGSADPGTHRVPVEIEVPNGDGRFVPHAFARANIPAATGRTALKVPASALVQREGSYSVWATGADGRAKPVRVQVLAQEGGQAVISAAEALPADARVVDLPPVDLVEGTRIAAVSR